jgi:hypothetical protein
VVDCVLARGCRVDMNKSKRKGKDVASDAPVQSCGIDDGDAVNLAIALRDGNAFNGGPSEKNSSDEFYRACLVILPQAGVFYCHRERRSLLTGELNSHVPMDINWLRLRHDSRENCFGKGSYVSRLANEVLHLEVEYSPFAHEHIALPRCGHGGDTKITAEIRSLH